MIKKKVNKYNKKKGEKMDWFKNRTIKMTTLRVLKN